MNNWKDGKDCESRRFGFRGEKFSFGHVELELFINHLSVNAD